MIAFKLDINGVLEVLSSEQVSKRAALAADKSASAQVPDLHVDVRYVSSCSAKDELSDGLTSSVASVERPRQDPSGPSVILTSVIQLS
jgi:hypothetical protein